LIKLDTKIGGRHYQFAEIKGVLAQANEEKSGDLLAQIGSQSEIERIAAKSVLSQLPLSVLRDQPVVAYEQDEVTRLIDDSLDPVKPMLVLKTGPWLSCENFCSIATQISR
jgi:ethanolamine ammonia-lyase large subunit